MKGLSFFLSIVAVLAAAGSALLYMLVGDEREGLEADNATLSRKLAQTERRVSELAAERDKLATSLSEIESTINETKARNTALEARNAQLSREVLRSREQTGAQTAAQTAAQDEIAELRRQLLDAQSRAAISANSVSAEQLAACEARIADLEAQLSVLRRLSGEASAPASAETLARVPADLTATVVEVGPRSAFVVLDIGSRHGAVPALELVLRRDSILVARVRITDVKDGFCIAHVLPHSTTGPVRIGDVASRS